MQLHWNELGTSRADAADDTTIEVLGFITTPIQAERTSHCLLVPEPPCCVGCMPRDPIGAIEVFAASPIPITGRPVRLTGTWRLRNAATRNIGAINCMMRG